MITIISGSNRRGNLTSIFAKHCLAALKDMNLEANLFSLDEIPNGEELALIYDFEHSAFAKTGRELIKQSDKLLFIAPEYNGSIPGILKLFIDAVEPKDFEGKKAALIGTAAGRAGNLRGMDHLTDVLHHLQVNVMPQKLPISQLYALISDQELTDQDTIGLIKNHLNKFIHF